MNPIKKEVAIIYGFTESSWQGKELRKELRKAGFSVTKDAEHANALIAHSGGCFVLPEKSRADVVVLVGLPFYPEHRLMKSLKDKVRMEVKDLWWYKKTFFNTVYLFAYPLRWIKMWRAWQSNPIPATDESLPVIAIRNRHDNFLNPASILDLEKTSQWKLTSLPGHHDDIWINPKPYVDIIKTSLKHA